MSRMRNFTHSEIRCGISGMQIEKVWFGLKGCIICLRCAQFFRSVLTFLHHDQWPYSDTSITTYLWRYTTLQRTLGSPHLRIYMCML